MLVIKSTTHPNKRTNDTIDFDANRDYEQDTQNFSICIQNLRVQLYMNDIQMRIMVIGEKCDLDWNAEKEFMQLTPTQFDGSGGGGERCEYHALK